MRRILKHLLYYGIFSATSLLTARFFLTNMDAGPSWALQGFPLDDTWIHLVYARSLANLGWFYYNPGIAEAGMSSPLWVVALAIPIKLGLGPVVAAKSVSITFGILTSIMVYHLALELTDRRSIAWIAGLAVAAEPNFAFARVSGMEVPLVAFFLLWSLLLLHRRSYRWFGIVLGLAIITRGEMAVFGILAGIAVLVERLGRPERFGSLGSKSLKLASQVYVPSLLLGGAWTLYNFLNTGNPLPNTYYVKHYFGLGLFNPDSLNAIWMGYLRHASLTRMWLAAPFFALLLFGGYSLYRKHGLRSTPLLLAPLLFVYSLSLNFMLARAYWNFAGRRHLDFIWPLVLIPILYGVARLWEIAEAAQIRWLMLGVPIALMPYTALILDAGIERSRMLASEYSWNCRNIEEVSVQMGRWIDTNLPQEATIAVTDAGAMRYFGGRETFDMLGLNWSEAIGRRLDELILEVQPDYAILFRSDEIDSWPFLTELYNIRPERNTILGGGDLVVYEFIGQD
jgi:hypothetical protein